MVLLVLLSHWLEALKCAVMVTCCRYQNELHKAVNARKPCYLQHGELVKLMKWKLMVLYTCYSFISALVI